MNYYYQGVWRMDWGLGNPNKTAALIAILMVSVWFLICIKKKGIPPLVWIIFTGLGCCLMHTFSRGGILAAFGGLASMLFFVPKPWSKGMVLAAIGSLWLIAGFAFYLNAHSRMGQGFVQEDKSITNRVEIWKQTPKMIADAPEGWGVGKSASAYSNWYQDVLVTQEYKNLVSTHLTWLVELGWLGRIGYILGWLVVLLMLFPNKPYPIMIVGFGAWTAFFIACMFSAVAESVWLWIIPVVFLLVALWIRFRECFWPRISTLGMTFLVSITICVVFVGIGSRSTLQIPIHKQGEIVFVGEGNPVLWMLHPSGTKVIGTKPGKVIRAFYSNTHKGIAVATSLQQITSSVSKLGIFGIPAEDDLKWLSENSDKIESLIIVNPAFDPNQIDASYNQKIKVIFGEFYQSPHKEAWKQKFSDQFIHINGAGEYIKNIFEYLI